ncbi:uncharacterized protein EKO05_0001285 [Ascochyta rabiei]|uniref:Uncharacterized protein n=1 Tax=Didymella rabiei TaxID=5454 RepID=A0A163D468_DIDRA|nr:uncharacterized protein EKO05_0001285 [Ascochyta rabiei]KZM22897.1 hypothetical protein ST47_g5982 [Ascochyta rabiei]UPX10639.1 hypothetical protein EKO05_0001285 [Ascochyta rabiei]
MPPLFTIEEIEGTDISDVMLAEAAALFSSSYGVWGPLASEKMGKSCKPGNRITLTPSRLRDQHLPPAAPSILIRSLSAGQLAGHALATRWQHAGRTICWVTQLCVHPALRRQRVATEMLRALRERHSNATIFGILSSHPAAILAALRAFGRGIEEDVDLDMVRGRARGIMDASPVEYVKGAKLVGSLFGREREDGEASVYCADTEFWVDHAEPMAALKVVRERGVA